MPRNKFAGRYKRNEYITSPSVFVIDEKGDKVGVMAIKDALLMARDAELDLVEVAPNADPPVCKIVSWSKFRYQQQQRTEQSGKKQKKLKEFRFKAGIGINDKERKIRRGIEFLDKGHPVKITLVPTRRVLKMSIKDIFNELLTHFEDYSRITDVQRGARRMSVTFKKKNIVKDKKNHM